MLIAAALTGAAVLAVLIVVLVRGGDSPETTTLTNPSESMEPTYSVGEELTINLDAYADDPPEIGDVVIFHPPLGADNGTECGISPSPGEACPAPTAGASSQTFMKRIAAGPGDALSIRNGRAVVNDEEADEPFTNPCGAAAACNMPETITVPPGHFFMLGDNRGASDDSRFWGPVPEDQILGEVE